MGDLARNTSLIRANQGAQVVRKAAAGSGNAGDAVVLGQGNTVTANASSTGKAIGLVVSTSKKAATFASGDDLGICVFGPVGGFSGLVPGTLVFLSSTAGRVSDTGTVPIGYAYSTTEVFVMPGVTSAASSS